MREIVDPVEPAKLKPLFNELFNEMQKANKLKQFQYFDDYYILSVDATGQFYSGKINCPECCIKTNRNGEINYYHHT